MSDPASAAATIPGRPHPSITPQHSYGTRIRQHSALKPPARLRQSSDPVVTQRKIRPVLVPSKSKQLTDPEPLPGAPTFPPPHVMLHEDDSTSKVFLAIGRSFLSVDNRAMTIKDLAEMTMKFGLMCQNVSAAGQAITTYIRNHMQRCEDQQDQPLLLRHILSGTPSDDELVPALHSRSGGAHCALPSGDNRTTNFRRGTMVWYLSRAAGAPCPFARAGIRLCEYTENGKIGSTAKDPKERKRERDRKRRAEQCGQKRKRLSRACADGSVDSAESGSDVDNRPPKVKLTLRLKPSPFGSSPSPSHDCPPPPGSLPTVSDPFFRDIIDLSKDSDSEREDSMSVDSESSDDDSTDASPSPLPPYYAPNSAYFRMPSPSSFAPPPDAPTRLRRSPSTPQSDASPPPDSEDDEDYFNTSMFHLRRHMSDHAQGALWEDEDDDIEWDNEEDDADDEGGDTNGPTFTTGRPVDQLGSNVVVKREESDFISGELNRWDAADSTNTVVRVVSRYASTDTSVRVKEEEVDSWNFDTFGAPNPSTYELEGEGDPLAIKQEEEEFIPSLITVPLCSTDELPETDLVCGSPLTPLSAFSPSSEVGEMRWSSLRRPSELLWKDADILGPDSILPQELEEGEWDSRKPSVEGGAPTSSRSASEAPSVPSAAPDTPSADSDDPQEDVPTTPPSTISSLPSWRAPISVTTSESLVPPSGRSVLQPTQEERPKAQGEAVVVHTCEPCTPAVSATQLEGVSVYQMILGPYRLLRRIDTDFVHLSSIVSFLNIPASTMTSVPNASSITLGSHTVCGTWAPLAEAQAFVQKHHPPDPRLDVFLSDQLFERFPSALQDFHRSNTRGRLLNKFGSQFQSTTDARRAHRVQARRVVPLSDVCLPWERGMMSYTDIEEHVLSVHPSLVLPENPVKRVEDHLIPETPLSPTEQEMFHSLCDLSDWDNTPLLSGPVPPSPEDRASRGDQHAEDADMEEDADCPTATRMRSHSRDRPLRRSKRVANAAAARTRTRSTKRGSRTVS
ncbi:hypothetical protein BV25DRAFT_1804163 [Artomyces pyxidatus]|uniref:Uncharacterized protein n=1 Tax=Artomyces pyxidatus TaxID=48021 RepID=A0ACB8T1X5_9AGAM|nr:hypothetical protein BV25DRAFT_1804163 [Artomyces pyxidatus]